MLKEKTRRLVAIMFADIVGYTAMMQRNEEEGLATVHHFSRVVENLCQENFGEILEFRGDGCMVVFDSAVNAIRAAKGIQYELMKFPGVPLRIGVHIGDIVFAKGNIYGDAVNLASRIESIGVPGSVLLSGRVAIDIKNHPEFELITLGKFHFKNVEKPIEVFALNNDNLVIPQRSAVQGKLQKTKSNTLKWWAAGTILIAICLTGIFAINQHQSIDSATVPVLNVNNNSIPDNSIAVLPFKNRSDSEKNQYFTDGIHDDLLTQLSKIGGMKVISQTSVNVYRNTSKTSSEIGKELAVANLLEGSVRRSQNQVRINVQLIQANTGEQLWSEIYDRELTTNNIFDIQSEIATKIASILKTVITPQQQKSLAKLPTSNLEAYEDYLRGRQLMEARNAESLYGAINLFQKALKHDSEFALAYIHLGATHALLPFYANEDEDTNFQIASEYLEKGMAINDRMAEAYALKGYLIFCIEKNLEQASVAFEKAISINPNYETTYLWYGFAVKGLSNDYERALKIHEKALRLNPLSPAILWNYAALLIGTGDMEEGVIALKKGINLNPGYPFFWETLSEIYISHGQLDSAAIIAYQGIENNGYHGRFLINYLWCLELLDMVSEIEGILNRMNLYNKQDSIIYFNYLQEIAFLGKNNEEMVRLNHQLTPFEIGRNKLSFMNQWYSNLADFGSSFYQRKFSHSIRVFETHFPDAGSQNENKPDVKLLAEYIYCLKKIGQLKKAEKLLKANESLFENSNVWGSILFHFLKDNQEEGLRELINLYKDNGKLYWRTRPPWQYLDYYPIFDEVRHTSEYQNLIDGLKTEIAEQRSNFRDYLATNKQM